MLRFGPKTPPTDAARLAAAKSKREKAEAIQKEEDNKIKSIKQQIIIKNYNQNIKIIQIYLTKLKELSATTDSTTLADAIALPAASTALPAASATSGASAAASAAAPAVSAAAPDASAAAAPAASAAALAAAPDAVFSVVPAAPTEVSAVSAEKALTNIISDINNFTTQSPLAYLLKTINKLLPIAENELKLIRSNTTSFPITYAKNGTFPNKTRRTLSKST